MKRFWFGDNSQKDLSKSECLTHKFFTKGKLSLLYLKGFFIVPFPCILAF